MTTHRYVGEIGAAFTNLQVSRQLLDYQFGGVPSGLKTYRQASPHLRLDGDLCGFRGTRGSLKCGVSPRGQGRRRSRS